MEKQLGWACKLGDMESQGIQGGANSVSSVDKVSDMAPVCGSVSLWGEVSEKGQWTPPTFLSGRNMSPSSCLDARQFSSSLYATGAFQPATLVWSSEGVSLSRSTCGFFKAGVSNSFSLGATSALRLSSKGQMQF